MPPTPVPPAAYEGEEYFCRFTPYIHSDAHLADAGCWQCQLDLLSSQGDTHARAVRSRSTKSYAVGCINPIMGNFVALCATDAIPNRLKLISYIVEYAYVHDDIIEYAEEKSEAQLREANHQLIEGLEDNADNTARLVTRNNAKRQLQAKMATQLLDVDKKRGQEILQLWKEMSNAFVGIRELDFKTLDEYLPWRAVDAGCPWTMALLCFSMNFYRTDEEIKQTSAMTSAAYDAWVLANDYFSWEKEHENYKANGSTGQIVSCIFLFMKWYNVDCVTARGMVKKEIIAREKKFCDIKNQQLTLPGTTDRVRMWAEMLVHVTAGNFAWSMTTARYHDHVEDAYPGLRAANQEEILKFNGLSNPIMPIPTRDSPTSCDCEGETLPDIMAFEEIAMEPYVYLKSLPSKGLRNTALDGLNVWYQVPETSFRIIQEVTELLHSSSLMVDDIQDKSLLRRGFPATHTVFGIAQTINAANLLLSKATESVAKLSPAAVIIFTSRLIKAHIGQGMDLYWAQQTKVPSIEEYFTMVDGKTSGLFILMAELMRSEATANNELDMTPLMEVVGRFFQARDDYLNLHDADYTSQKGFVEDLNSGKISLPLIYALGLRSPQMPQRGRLLSIMQQSKAGTLPGLSPELRKLALADTVAAGGLAGTREILGGLQGRSEALLAQAEQRAGTVNWILRLMVRRLEVEVEVEVKAEG